MEERAELKWSQIKWQQLGKKRKKLSDGFFFFNESDGLLMPLSGMYSKIENVTTFFYFTKIDTILIGAFFFLGYADFGYQFILSITNLFS